MKRRVTLISVLCLMIVGAAVAPVMAIGPFQALEVGNNENLDGVSGLLVFNDNPSNNTILWGSQGRIILSMTASKGQGRMNNAIIANITILSAMINNPDYANKWIYLSGDGGSNIEQFEFTIPPYPNRLPYTYYATLGSHGMLYWFSFFVFGLNAAQNDALDHPDGVYLQIINTGQ